MPAEARTVGGEEQPQRKHQPQQSPRDSFFHEAAEELSPSRARPLKKLKPDVFLLRNAAEELSPSRARPLKKLTPDGEEEEKEMGQGGGAAGRESSHSDDPFLLRSAAKELSPSRALPLKKIKSDEEEEKGEGGGAAERESSRGDDPFLLRSAAPPGHASGGGGVGIACAGVPALATARTSTHCESDGSGGVGIPYTRSEKGLAYLREAASTGVHTPLSCSFGGAAGLRVHAYRQQPFAASQGVDGRSEQRLGEAGEGTEPSSPAPWFPVTGGVSLPGNASSLARDAAKEDCLRVAGSSLPRLQPIASHRPPTLTPVSAYLRHRPDYGETWKLAPGEDGWSQDGGQHDLTRDMRAQGLPWAVACPRPILESWGPEDVRGLRGLGKPREGAAVRNDHAGGVRRRTGRDSTNRDVSADAPPAIPGLAAVGFERGSNGGSDPECRSGSETRNVPGNGSGSGPGNGPGSESGNGPGNGPVNGPGNGAGSGAGGGGDSGGDGGGGGGGKGDGGGSSDTDPDEGPECRVCRGGDEGGTRPLVHPCRCSGSIKYVHQDCLVEWLRSRQGGINAAAAGAAAGAAGGGAEAAAAGPNRIAIALQAQRCELCRERLVFKARYRPGAPVQLGLSQFLRGAARRATPRLMDAFRGTLNMLMWGVAVPVLYCAMFRMGLGVALLFAQEFAAFVRGGNAATAPVFLKAIEASTAGVQTNSLPGIERIWWWTWMDLLGDWCGGVTLMIGVMCLGPPCVELAVEFVSILKLVPIWLEHWWLGEDAPAPPGQNGGGADPPREGHFRAIPAPRNAHLPHGNPPMAMGRMDQHPAIPPRNAPMMDGNPARDAAILPGNPPPAPGGPDHGNPAAVDAAFGPAQGNVRAEDGEIAPRGRDGGGHGEAGHPRDGVLGALDRVEWMLMGVLEQLAAPPREEDVDGEALFLWGWPAVGTAGGFLAFMGLLVLFAQTLPFATYHAVSGAVRLPLPSATPRGSSRGASTSPPGASGFRPLPAELFSWNSVVRPSPSASIAFSYTSLEAKAHAFGLESLGYSPKWGSFGEGGVSDPGFSVGRNRTAALHLLSSDPGLGTVAVGTTTVVIGSGLPLTTATASAAGGEMEKKNSRPLSSSASHGGQDGGDGGAGTVALIARKPHGAGSSTTRRNSNDGYGRGKISFPPVENPAGSSLGRLVQPGDRWESLGWWLAERRRALEGGSVGGSALAWKEGPWMPGRRALRGPGAPKEAVYGGGDWGGRIAPGSRRAEAFQRSKLVDAEQQQAWPSSGRPPSDTNNTGLSTVTTTGGSPRTPPPSQGAPIEASGGKKNKKSSRSRGGSKWWSTTLSFLRGPIIPGTAGLRVGAVFCETIKGHGLLVGILLLLCLAFSAARLRRAPNRHGLRGIPWDGLPAGAAAYGGVGVNQGQGGNVPNGREAEHAGFRVEEAVGMGGMWMGRGGQAGGRGGAMAGGGMLERDGQIGMDLKVMTIGLLELFVLPLWVGINADIFSLSLLASTLEARVAWAATNPLSSLALHWGAGSMATGVVSCLAREIVRALKPNLLPPWALRPPEQGLEEMLVRMTHDAFLTQLRGFLISVVAYPAALALMMMVPINYRAFFGKTWPRWLGGRLFQGVEPVVLGIGEPTQGDRLGMDLVLFHFILPVVMEHLKIRGPVRRAVCWVLTTGCGVTGTRGVLLHPALAMGRGAEPNDPDDLDDVELPPPPPPRLPDPQDSNSNDVVEGQDGQGVHRPNGLWEGFRVSAAFLLVCVALTVMPAATVLLPLLTGRAMFGAVGLPLDDDLPPLVAGAISCSATAWALSGLFRLRVAAGEHRRIVLDVIVLIGKWMVIGTLLLGVLPGLTGLLVHDALRGPLPPAEETAALTWGKIWALGLVCVKLWARCVMAGAVGDETWQGRLRRVRVNGIRGIDFKFTLLEVCIPLLDRVGQYYFFPYLMNRFVLPLLVTNQRDLRILQKGMPFVYLLMKAMWAAAMYGVKKVKALHDVIRDDEYLVGLELENRPPQGHDSSS